MSRSREATRYLLGGLRTALPALAGVCGMLLAIPALPWVPELVRPLRAIANAERRRAGTALGREIPAPYPEPDGAFLERSAMILRSPATWRDAAWMVIHGFSGLVAAATALCWPGALYSLTLPLWWWAAPPGSVTAFVPLRNWPEAVIFPLLEALLAGWIVIWLIPRLARWQARLAGLLLSPTARTRLTERVEQLTQTRAEALEAHGAELRRIERDLHDGTQAQFVSAALRLGLADSSFDTDPGAARELLLDARDGIEEGLGQLRSVIRGIYPPILADRGLPGALHALAAGVPVPVEVHVAGDMARAPAAVEAAAYFVVAEALTNITRHSGARRASVSVRRRGEWLRIVVRDDGKGGADDAAGSGQAGIRRRVAALDGTTRIDSPPGEGTTLEVDLPCGS